MKICKRMELVLIFSMVCLVACGELKTPMKSETLAGDCVNLLDLKNRRIGTAVVVNGMLYYTDLARMRSDPSSIVAYDIRKSEQQWVAPGESYTPLVLQDGKLYHLDRLANTLTAFSLEDGQPIWSVTLPPGEFWSEIVGGGNLVFVAGNEQLYAFDAMNGEFLWKHIETNSVIERASGPFTVGLKLGEYGALTYQEGILYARTCSHRPGLLTTTCSLLALNTANGEVEWRFSFDVPLIPSEGVDVAATQPAFDESHILFGSWGDQVFLLNRYTGALIWQREFLFPTGRPLLADGQALLTDSHTIVGINVDDNKLTWSMEIPDGVVISSPRLGAEGKAFFLARTAGESELSIVSAATGSIQGRHSIVDDEVRGVITAFEIESNRVYIVTESSVCMFEMP